MLARKPTGSVGDCSEAACTDEACVGTFCADGEGGVSQSLGGELTPQRRH